MITKEEALQKFRQEYYESQVIHIGTTWMGYKAQKYPGDAWIYQELIYRLKPDFIVETGTAFGGGTMFLANLCTLVGHGHVITVENDVNRFNTVNFPGQPITKILGSSTDQDTIDTIVNTIGGGTALVILDSDHLYDHVSRELELYPQFVKSGYYLIIEDTHMAATKRAVDDFLLKDNSFEIDKNCEKYIMTFNPGGFLRKR